MGAGPLVVTYPLTGRSRAIVDEELGGTAEAIYLVDLAPAARAHALGCAGAVPQCSTIAIYRRWRRLGADPRSAVGITGCSQ